MRALMLASFTLVCLPITAGGQAVAEPARGTGVAIAGLPALDRTWSAQDFEAAAAALSSLPAGRLPHSGDPGAAALFDRLTDRAATAPCTNAEAPLDSRLNECLRLLNASVRIFGLYGVAQQSDRSYSDDVMRLMGFILRPSAAVLDLAEEFTPTLDRSDPTYATRMQGLERMRAGAIMVVQGSLVSLTTDRRVYSDAVAAAFASVLAETYPALSRNFPAETKAQCARTLASIARDDPSAEVRAALSAYAG